MVILPAAQADLIDIGDFIALDNPPRAASFVAEIEAKIREVGERPGSFQKRDDLHKGLRHARHGRYLIFFIETGDEVQIVRVMEGSRDLPRVLKFLTPGHKLPSTAWQNIGGVFPATQAFLCCSLGVSRVSM
nr:type II toxin-antitoxin system RelE/ParE family toxin [Pseudaestuariivita rosea]